MVQDSITQQLKHFKPSRPKEDLKEQNILNAVSAFEQEKKRKSLNLNQGSLKEDRLISNIKRYISNLGDLIMKKTLITSGVIATCAAVFILSQTTFLSSPWQEKIHSKEQDLKLEEEVEARIVPIENLSDAEDTTIISQNKNATPPIIQPSIDNKLMDLAAPAPTESTQEYNIQPKKQKADTGGKLAPLIFSDKSTRTLDRQNIQAERSIGSGSADAFYADEAEYIAPIVPPVVIQPTTIYEPNAHQTETYQHFVQNHVKQVSQEPVSTFSADVDTASYSVVRKSINNGYFPQAHAVRVEEMINYFNYHYEVPRDQSEPFKPTVAVYPTPWNANTKLMHIGIKGYDIEPSEKPKSNLVFLIDVSGSMNSYNKLPLLKKSFNMLLNSLNPTDTVSIVVYAGAAGTVLEPTEVREKHKIISALNRLSAGGSTAGAQGIQQAYHLAQQNYIEGGVNRVFLATDGDFNIGIRNQEQLKQFISQKRETGIFLSVLGFGSGNYNDHTMQSLAQNGNGNAAYIDSLQEAQKVLVDEASSTLFTIAKDVKFQVEFNPERISEYRLIGYETRHLNREDFNNDKIDAGDIGSGHTVTAIYEITPKGVPTTIDPLRYGKSTKAEETTILSNTEMSNEYAFLKLRYKLPDSTKSTLMTRPITDEDVVNDIHNTSNDIRFAASVAAFGQILKSNPLVQNSYSFDDVINLAVKAKGDDPMGYRNEFIKMVRIAKSLHDAGQVIPSFRR